VYPHPSIAPPAAQSLRRTALSNIVDAQQRYGHFPQRPLVALPRIVVERIGIGLAAYGSKYRQLFVIKAFRFRAYGLARSLL
jgi:hypothetical protein